MGFQAFVQKSFEHGVRLAGIFARRQRHELMEIPDELGLIVIAGIQCSDPFQRRIEHELGQAAHESLAPQ